MEIEVIFKDYDDSAFILKKNVEYKFLFFISTLSNINPELQFQANIFIKDFPIVKFDRDEKLTSDFVKEKIFEKILNYSYVKKWYQNHKLTKESQFKIELEILTSQEYKDFLEKEKIFLKNLLS